MRKIKLNLESMSVESFETAVVSAEQGTVVAHQLRTFNGCGSEVDRCPSARGCTFVGDCVTQLC
jgi:hypothetical protein